MRKYNQPPIKFNKTVKYILINTFFGFLLLWGALNHVIINENIFLYNWQYIFSVLLFMLILIKLSKVTNFKIPSSIKEVVILILGIPLIIYMFSVIILERTIPSLLHIIISKPGKITVIVDAKLYKLHRNCHNGVQLKNYDNLLNGQLCYLDKKMLNTLKSNDELILSGTKSIFGFTVENVLQNDNKILKEK